MSDSSLGTALITGASEGIGAVYADRLARRGYDLVLVARRRDKLEALASRIAGETGRSVELLVADLTDPAELAKVETRLRDGAAIDLLVNNAGLSTLSSFANLSSAQVSDILSLNVVALTRLAWAAMGPMTQRGHGTIINIGSVVALSHLPNAALYAGTKAFVLTLTQALAAEASGQGLRFQAVLPGATRTNIWVKSGLPVEHLPQEIVMETADMVDAALAGLDQGELVTIPALADASEWERVETARLALANKLSLAKPASRYLA
jgi:short-subunit dehydrogenase